MLVISCSDPKETLPVNTSSANLIIKLKFDPSQERLNNFGQPSTLPAEDGAQSPIFSKMSLSYIELAPQSFTALGQGDAIFVGNETMAGGSKAIDFQNARFAGNGETFITIPIKDIRAGHYEWLRTSRSYQEGNIKILSNGTEYNGPLASFLGYNSYITNFNLNGSNVPVNSNKLQGFWAFETQGFVFQGQAPAGATTVPNPIFSTSPVPEGSCVMTGKFENGLTISGFETRAVTVVLFFSVNQSFEWTEVNFDGKYEPSICEQVVDMGIRGLKPLVE